MGQLPPLSAVFRHTPPTKKPTFASGRYDSHPPTGDLFTHRDTSPPPPSYTQATTDPIKEQFKEEVIAARKKLEAERKHEDIKMTTLTLYNNDTAKWKHIDPFEVARSLRSEDPATKKELERRRKAIQEQAAAVAGKKSSKTSFFSRKK